MDPPLFLLDFNSPYAYLAATRVDTLLPVRPRWVPVALWFILQAAGRVPWSLREETRAPGMAECERRAETYGLPSLVWPPGWPRESYSLAPLRAAHLAGEHGRLRPFCLAAFARNFVSGEGLATEADLVSVALAAGLDPDVVCGGLSGPAANAPLRDATDAAIAAGVTGVPTVLIAGEVFWGDDRLSDAARALT